jgi:predicted dehydrogenase
LVLCVGIGQFIDTLLYLLDDPEPVSISGTLSELHTADGDNNNLHFVQDTPILSAFVRFDNDTSLHAAATGISGEYELVCQEGIIRIQNDGESIRVRQKNQDAYDPIEVAPIEPWSGTAQKIRELVESIKTGKPGISNLRATMLGTEIGFGLYESHLQGGIAIQPPVPNRGRWVSSW